MKPLECGRRVGPQKSWTEVPGEVLAHPGLGAPAVRLWAYAWWRLGLEGWILTKRDMALRCRLGEDAWRRAVGELERARLYRLDRSQAEAGERDPGGRAIGGRQRIVHVFYWPGSGD